MNSPNTILHQFFADSGLTQTEVSRAMKFNKGYVSRVLRGERPLTDGFLWRFREVFVEPESTFYLPDAANVLHEIKRELA